MTGLPGTFSTLTIRRVPNSKGNIATSSNTEVLLDGRHIHGLKSVRIAAGGPLIAQLEIFVHELAVEHDGLVTVEAGE